MLRFFENIIEYEEDGVQKSFKKVKACLEGKTKEDNTYFDVVIAKKCSKEWVKKTIDFLMPFEIDENQFNDKDYFITNEESTAKNGKVYNNLKLIIMNVPEDLVVKECERKAQLTFNNFR